MNISTINFLAQFSTRRLLKTRICDILKQSYQPSSRLSNGKMQLSEVVSRLQKHAPSSLAASWDNVGLLVEPSPPHSVTELLLTNDLTLDVFDEAIEKKVNMIISYHPPIFRPLKRLTQRSWKERLMVKCIENRIAVYAPHTSFDCVKDGITDWLISPFGGKTRPVKVHAVQGGYGYGVAVNMPSGIVSGVVEKISAIPGSTVSGHTRLNIDGSDNESVRLHLNCSESSLSQIVGFFEGLPDCHLEILKFDKQPVPGHGDGRVADLDQPITISSAVDLVKSHLKLSHVRLACARQKTPESLVRSVAVCAGSGGEVLAGVKVDLLLTGEMSHHEVLDATQNGTTVILCDHTNTERGFLSVFRDRLDSLLENKVNIHVSCVDRDPLIVV